MRLEPLPARRRGPCESRREPMCGIVGAVAERDVVPILMEGLRRLEYRGYDSAGLAVLNGSKHLTRLRTVGKGRSEEHTAELQSQSKIVCRLLLEKKKKLQDAAASAPRRATGEH